MKKLIDLEVRDKILIAAHRGASGTQPENTIPAFEQAIAEGVDMIETDVQQTSDGMIITYHDLSVSDNTGSINIQETKYADLPLINADFGTSIADVVPPKLIEVYRLIKGKVYLIIEIKEINNHNYKAVINEIIKMAKQEDVSDQILLSSFYPDYIRYSKSIAPYVPTASIKIPNRNALPSDLHKLTGCEAFICSVDELNEKMMEDVERHNIFTGVYSVDDEEALKKALNYKVNAVATNFPKKIVELLRK